MADDKQLRILKEGVEAWNRWRRENPQVRANLFRADLRGANLREANLQGVDLAEASLNLADLRRANLAEADLQEANLDGAILAGANLYGVNLGAANLRAANLSGAYLGWANLRQAVLSEADLTCAEMQYAVFGGNDLSTAKGLETVLQRRGPSTIDIDTIYRSGGKIPEVFLRWAGVPDDFIIFMKSIVTNPAEYYSCFISYSSKDEEFALRLCNDLQARGVRCWFAPHDIQGGRKLHEQIDQAIRVHERVLLILSAHSMNSEWVKTEIAKARRREVEQKKQVLFPLRLVSFEAIRDWECFDADAGKDSAGEIREYFIPDFSNWKNHDKYQKAFERLIKDLKAGEKGEGKMAT